MTEPIKPSDVVSIKPSQVFEVFNKLIAENWDGDKAKIYTEEVVENIAERMRIKVKMSTVFVKEHPYIKEAYEQQGWNVIYHKTSFKGRHLFPSFFVFSSQV